MKNDLIGHSIFDEEDYPFQDTETQTENNYIPVEQQFLSSPFAEQHFSATEEVMKPTELAKKTATNKQNVARSGIAVEEITGRLNRFINDPAGHVSSVDVSFTEAVRQFQIAHFINPREHDGLLGASTLDTLGFINHGLSSRINSGGLYGQGELNRGDVKPQIPVLTNDEFSSSNWFQYITKPAWLGVKISDGVHVLLLRKLKEAELWLLKQPQYSGMTPAALGRAVGFTGNTQFSASRLSAVNQAMHGFGLAIDIDVAGNPWIGAGWIKWDKILLQERTRMIEAFKNASNNSRLPGATVFAYLDSIAQTAGSDTAEAYRILKQRNDEFVSYIQTHPAELSYWRQSQTFANRNPLNGFLNLHTDLVYALRQIAGLAWGAIDFGPRASGDIMHFDLRTIGVGKFICKKIGGFVDFNQHPAVSNELKNLEGNFEINADDEHSDALELHEAIGEAEWNDDEVSSGEIEPEFPVSDGMEGEITNPFALEIVDINDSRIAQA